MRIFCMSLASAALEAAQVWLMAWGIRGCSRQGQANQMIDRWRKGRFMAFRVYGFVYRSISSVLRP